MPLPPDWTFPGGLWPLLADAKQQLGILEGLGRNLPNPAILLRPLADREAIRSSRLEGTYATAKELLLFDLEPKESTSKADPVNDQREVFNYRRALFHGAETELPLSARLLKDMHRILLERVRGRDRAPGEFRKVQVAIGSAARFVPPPPERLLECIDSLEKYLHTTSSGFDPLVDCFLVHYQFETIHPFMDGNGRVGRLLLALMLQQRCGLSKPWLYMSEYFDKNRDEYINGLFRISTDTNWHDWMEFCIRGTLQQARDTNVSATSRGVLFLAGAGDDFWGGVGLGAFGGGLATVGATSAALVGFGFGLAGAPLKLALGMSGQPMVGQ